MQIEGLLVHSAELGEAHLAQPPEVLDAVIGKRGTARREEHEAAIDTFLIGEAIREACLSKNLTQEQLGERMGVKKSQVSKIEKGQNLKFSTMSRAFRALGVEVSFEVAGIGRVALLR